MFLPVLLPTLLFLFIHINSHTGKLPVLCNVPQLAIFFIFHKFTTYTIRLHGGKALRETIPYVS